MSLIQLKYFYLIMAILPLILIRQLNILIFIICYLNIISSVVTSLSTAEFWQILTRCADHAGGPEVAKAEAELGRLSLGYWSSQLQHSFDSPTSSPFQYAHPNGAPDEVSTATPDSLCSR